MTYSIKQLFRGASAALLAAACCIVQARAEGTTAPEAAEAADQPCLMFRVGADRSTAAVSSIPGSEAYDTPTSNLTNTLYGRLSGLSVMQGSGQLGYDMALMTIRGKGTFNEEDTFTVFVDGFETDPSYMTHLLPSEIDRVYVLKDAAALSTFGMRGANGVLWIETKRGETGKIKVDLNLRTGWQSPKLLTRPLGSAPYAAYYNEAVSNDNGNVWTPAYSPDQIARYRMGQGVDVDWYDEVLKQAGSFTSTDVSVSGGSKAVRFFTMLGYVNSNGFYDVDKDDTRSNTRFDEYVIRTNLDFTVFKIFDGRVDIGGRMIDNKRPNYSDDQLWYNLSTYPNNIYNVYDGRPDNDHWSGTMIHPDNPAASVRGLGYRSNRDRSFQANFSLRERLDFLTPGLYLSESASFAAWTRGTYNMVRNYTRWHDGTAQTADVNTDYAPEDDRGTNQWSWNQLRVQAGYDRTFGAHSLTAAVAYEHYRRYVDADMNGNAGIQTTYAHQAVSGRVNYAYDARYVAEFGFSYSGSDNYAAGNRFRFYPSASAAWILSNERFLRASKAVNLLKLRFSVGSLGYDYHAGGRYLYYQYYVGGNSFPTGNDGNPTWQPSLVPAYLADPDITSERSLKYNLGVDARLFNALQLSLDLYRDERTGIVTRDNSYPAGFGVDAPYRNVGEVTTEGLELSLNFDRRFGDFSLHVGGMLACLRDRIDYMAEIPPASPRATATGNPLGAVFGYQDDGFYDITDFDEAGNLLPTLPYPTFGTVQPGDVRYTDLNGDRVIDEQDKLKISDGANPNLYYALSASLAYKGFDLGFLLQGVGNRRVDLLDAGSKVIAFRNNSTIHPIATGRWAYYPDEGIDTRGSARFPRLSTGDNTNNYQHSTLWIENGNFLTLRNIELGYTLPARIGSKIGLRKVRVYLSGVNLLTFSPLKRKYGMDAERMTGYPGVKSYNIGLSVGF